MNVVDLVNRARRLVTEDLWQFDLQTVGSLPRFAVSQVRLGIMVVRGFLNDHCLLRASALTYTTMLAIVPILAVAFSVLKGLGVEDRLREQLIGRVTAVVRAAEADEQPGDAPAAERESPDDSRISSNIVDQFISSVENVSAARLGTIGAVLLVFSVISVLGNIEKSFNAIWGIRTPRTVARRFSDYLSAVIAGPLFLTLVSAINASLQSNTIVQGVLKHDFARLAVGHVAPLVMLWIAFTSLYVFMPNTRVRLGPALLGGVIGGTLWQVAQWVYIEFQVGVSKYNAIYGGFAQLPLFLVWLYMSWAIALLGAEIAFARQNLSTYSSERRALNASIRFREAIAMRIAVTTAAAFAKGDDPWTAERMSIEWRVPIRLINAVIFELESGGILRETGTEPVAYVPGRALDRILAADVIEALRAYGDSPPDMSSLSGEGRLRELLRQAEEAMRGVLGKTSLRELAESVG